MMQRFKVTVKHCAGLHPDETYRIAVSDAEEERSYFKIGLAKEKAKRKYAYKYNVLIKGQPAMACMKAEIVG